MDADITEQEATKTPRGNRDDGNDGTNVRKGHQQMLGHVALPIGFELIERSHVDIRLTCVGDDIETYN